MGLKESFDELLKHPLVEAFRNKGGTPSDSTIETILDWAYRQTLNPDMPLGLSDSVTLGNKYRAKYATFKEASEALILTEMSKISGVGFATSFGGYTTLVANIAGVLFMQLRLVNAMAHLAGCDLHDDRVRQLAYVSLLGAKASFFIKQQLFQEGSKRIVQKVIEHLAPRLVGSGMVSKAVPVVSSVVGTSFDAVATYAVVKAAQRIFLEDIINKEQYNSVKGTILTAAINIAKADGKVNEFERAVLCNMLESAAISSDLRTTLYRHMRSDEMIELDFSRFIKDKLPALELISSVAEVIRADGSINEVEREYLETIARKVKLSRKELNMIIEACHNVKLLNKV